MSWWKRILAGEDEAVTPRRLDYLNEGLALERQGDFEGAVTSYQLALRDQPHNVKVLQYIAIALRGSAVLASQKVCGREML